MKRNKELQSLKKAELESRLKELKMELMKENAQVATGTIPKNPLKIKNIKKNIARIMQLLSKGSLSTKKEA